MNLNGKTAICKVCGDELSSILGICPRCLTSAGQGSEPDAYDITSSQVADSERKKLILLARIEKKCRAISKAASAAVVLLVVIAALLAVLCVLSL